jgi:hypothetical protein
MANTTTTMCLPPLPSLEMAWRDVDSSFERFCLTAIRRNWRVYPTNLQRSRDARRNIGRRGGLEHPSESVTHPNRIVTVLTGGMPISIENSRLQEAAPTSVNVAVGRRSREYLTEREVERLIEAAKQNRFGYRDATAILVAYRHGLRASPEFERSIIQERVRAGLRRAKAEGKQLGRPRIAPELEARILAALKAPGRTEVCAR